MRSLRSLSPNTKKSCRVWQILTQSEVKQTRPKSSLRSSSTRWLLEYYERLQDHLANILDARQALDALREEHQTEHQARMLEAQRIRQQQMQEKLANVRRKKHVSVRPEYAHTSYNAAAFRILFSRIEIRLCSASRFVACFCGGMAI